MPGLRTTFPEWDNTEIPPPPGQDPHGSAKNGDSGQHEHHLSKLRRLGQLPENSRSFSRSFPKGPAPEKSSLSGGCLVPPPLGGEADLARFSTGSVPIAAHKYCSPRFILHLKRCLMCFLGGFSAQLLPALSSEGAGRADHLQPTAGARCRLSLGKTGTPWATANVWMPLMLTEQGWERGVVIA